MNEVKSLSVIIPLYNEEENILPLHQSLEGSLKFCQQPYEIIYVDDGSTDATFVELLALTRRGSVCKYCAIEPQFWANGCYKRRNSS